MKLIRIVPLVFLIALGAGCKKAKEKEKSEGEKAVEAMEKSVDDFCKCKGEDKPCQEKASAGGEEAEKKLETLFPDKDKAPKDLLARGEAASVKLMKCAETMGETGGPGTPEPGTGGDPTPPPAGDPVADANKILDEMRGLKDQVCACADQACAQPHVPKLEELDVKLKALFPDASNVPAEVTGAREQLWADIGACAAKFPQ